MRKKVLNLVSLLGLAWLSLCSCPTRCADEDDPRALSRVSATPTQCFL